MMKKWYLIFLTTFLLAGCWDATEPERMYYVHGLGVDYVDGKFKVYVQIIDFTNVAKSEQPQPDAMQAEVGVGTGETMYEAIFDLYHSIDMRVFWGHLSFIVMSESALEEGRANTVINAIARYRETRYRIWLYGTRDKISDIMVATPILNKSITTSSLSNPRNPYEQESYIAPVNFRQFILRLNEPNHVVGIPYVTLNKDWESQKGKQEKIEYKGIAFLSRTELKGILSGKDIQGILFMTDETVRTQITYLLKEKPITVTVANIKIDVKSKFVDGSFKFDIKVKLDAIVSDFHAEITETEVKESLKKEVEKRIKETYQKGLEQNIDIYRLSNYAYKQNIKNWKSVEEGGHVPLNSDSIASIQVNIGKLSAARKEFTETIDDN
ncbi:Ger(x)C family spore germination protein [Lysinibacillus sp. 3P01SB]|uniref:Ger(x)C family spore germination protein n=1 Tax=Lysinibacillus sp. 3P01SB TaxID=3132284 RepID=UPI0039A4B32A